MTDTSKNTSQKSPAQDAAANDPAMQDPAHQEALRQQQETAQSESVPGPTTPSPNEDSRDSDDAPAAGESRQHAAQDEAQSPAARAVHNNEHVPDKQFNASCHFCAAQQSGGSMPTQVPDTLPQRPGTSTG